MPEISVISAPQNDSELLSKLNQFLKLHIQYLCSDLLPNWRRRNFCLKNTVSACMLYCIATIGILVQMFPFSGLLKIDIFKASSL